MTLLLLWPVDLWAANHFVRAGATGTATGADWTNACTDFTGSCAVASLVRGDTYYVATGTYSTLNLNTADSGTLLISILGATAASHGTNTGWQNSFSVSASDGGAQAQFTYTQAVQYAVQILTDYWVVDGTIGSGNDPTTYGFRMKQTVDCTTGPQTYFQIGNSGVSQTTITAKHVALTSCGVGFNLIQRLFFVGCGACYVTNVTLAHNYVTDSGGFAGMTNVSNSTFEYNYGEKFHYTGTNSGKVVMGITNCHNSDVAGCATDAQCTQGNCAKNNTVRYNLFRDCGEAGWSGGLLGLGPGNALAMLSWSLYGNVFINCGGNSGTIAAEGGNFAMKDTVIYNNTFDSVAHLINQCNSTGSPGCASASGNVVKNNLLYNSVSAINAFDGAAIDHDYNSFISATDTPPSETHGQIATFQPFANYAGGNYHLANGTDVAAGLTLASPYNTDPDGLTRGADGYWDRGAYEFTQPPGIGSPGQHLHFRRRHRFMMIPQEILYPFLSMLATMVVGWLLWRCKDFITAVFLWPITVVVLNARRVSRFMSLRLAWWLLKRTSSGPPRTCNENTRVAVDSVKEGTE